ncbi:hypothetical protein [Serratia fonticola]|uniref:hypothetical protein n=1 Tax=Serratia fonticola TaxID=47917 RepID=UPI000BA22C2F|nr:hypothetical protein [Serratia fonticola]PAA96798.1 hypothetical protein CJJ13_15910 [Serratia fonticola]
MEIFSWSNFGTFLTWLSILASIIGGIYTILVYTRVTEIENKYLVKIRLPELISKLQDQNKDLPRFLSEFEQDDTNNKKKSAVSSSVHSIIVIMEDIKRKLELDKNQFKYSSPPISKWLLSVTDEKLSRMLNPRHLDIGGLWDIQSELSSVIMHLEQINLDLGWTRT